MRARVHSRHVAENLRRRGYSYNDIQNELGLAKSTLSCWLKDFPLTPEEKRCLKKRQDKNISRGRIKTAAALTRNRLAREREIYRSAKALYSTHAEDPFFVMGVALYWAEGSKRALQCCFTNSDEEMMGVMVKWSIKFLGLENGKITARLYTHRPFASENHEKIWSEIMNIPIENMKKTIYKPHTSLVKKRPNYKGCVRVELGGRANLLKMIYWQSMMVKEYLRPQSS